MARSAAGDTYVFAGPSLAADAIPVSARLMAVADVFDALAAKDRPYKKAVSVDRSLEILKDEAEVGLLDGEALSIFIEAKVYELTSLASTGP